MSQYTHLLIPSAPAFCPSAHAIATFLGRVIELGVVGDTPAISAWTVKRVAPQTRQGRNPLTGEPIVMQMPTRRPDRQMTLASVEEFPKAVAGSEEYEIHVLGFTLPAVSPLEIDFSDPYHLRVGCHVRAHPVSMCGLDEEIRLSRTAIPFGEDCSEPDALGLFTDPETLQVIEVCGAGCARFWIDVELGKLLFPRIANGNLQILNPQLVELARCCFDSDFVQGCLWSC